MVGCLMSSMINKLNEECIKLRQQIQDFENRKCINCKHYKDSARHGRVCHSEDGMVVFPRPDYACKYFKKKGL